MSNNLNSREHDAPVKGVGDLRGHDRYLISIAKCLATIETDDGQIASGYVSDVSDGGCGLVVPVDQLRLPTARGVRLALGEYRLAGRIVRARTFGGQITLGIDHAAMPAEFLESVRKMGGAIRFDHRTVTIIGKLNMPVAVKAMRLIGNPETVAIDLGECSNMEMAGAGFLMLAIERGKQIVRVSSEVKHLLDMAGIKLPPIAALA